MEEITAFAEQRMGRSGLTRDQVLYIIHHSDKDKDYETHGDRVLVATLPDGRVGKVRVRNGRVMDAFTIVRGGK